MRLFLLLPLLLGFSVPVFAHNKAYGGCGNHFVYGQDAWSMGEGPELASNIGMSKLIQFHI